MATSNSQKLAKVQALAPVVALHGYQKFSRCLQKECGITQALVHLCKLTFGHANICKVPEIQCHGTSFDMQGWLFNHVSTNTAII